MSGTPVRRQRAIQARVLRNDERLLDAALEAAADEGLPGLTYRRVALRAGLTLRALQDRYESPAELVVALWYRRCAAPLTADLAEVLKAAGQLDGPASAEALQTALSAFARPRQELLAGIELLLDAQFDLQLRQGVRGTLGAQVAEWCAPHPPRLSRALAARRAFVLCLALGLLLAARFPGSAEFDLGPPQAELLRALSAEAQPQILPRRSATYLDEVHVFDTGDPTRDALLRACLDVVGRVGFEGASVERIAKEADWSRGALFGRYPTKQALFLDATARQHADAYQLNEDFVAGIARERGEGIAQAVLVREIQRPGRELVRAINLEQFRLAWHNEELMKAEAASLEAHIAATKDPHWLFGSSRGAAHMDYAVNLGFVALPILYPECWRLPYDAVLLPLMGAAVRS